MRYFTAKYLIFLFFNTRNLELILKVCIFAASNLKKIYNMDRETAFASAKLLNEMFPQGSFVANKSERGTCVYRVKSFFARNWFYNDYEIDCDADFGYDIRKKILFDHTFGANDKVRFATASEISKLLELYKQANEERLRDMEKISKEKFSPSELMWVVYSLIKWESENNVKDNFLTYMDANKQYSPTLENVVQYCKLHHCVDKFTNYLFPPNTPLVHPIYHFIKEISSLLDKVK